VTYEKVQKIQRRRGLKSRIHDIQPVKGKGRGVCFVQKKEKLAPLHKEEGLAIERVKRE